MARTTHPAWTSRYQARDHGRGSRPRPKGDRGLSDGSRLDVDLIIMATGYKGDIARIEFIDAGNLRDEIAPEGGLARLDEHFQSPVPGLYMTSFLASRDFGPFLRFTVAARAAATVLGDELARVHAPR